MAELWFKRKRYGYGWTPVTWEGWAIVMGYAAALTGMAVLLPFRPTLGRVLTYAVATSGLTSMLIGLCISKGEPPRWQWGDEKKHDRSSD